MGLDLPEVLLFPSHHRAAAWPRITGTWKAMAGQALEVQHVGNKPGPWNQSGWLQI